MKRISKGLFKPDALKEVTGFDLFYQLTYMSAVAGAGISRSRIFTMGAGLPRMPAKYFGRVHLLSQKLGYDYARACSMVGLAIKSETMVSLLLRLSNALTSGQPEVDFLNEEVLVQGTAYEKEYDRDLASLTKWTDAYAAITMSSALIVIINMTSSLIYSMGTSVFVGLVVTAASIAGITAWILSRAAPKEEIDAFSDEGPWSQRWARKLAIYLPPAALIVCPPLVLLGVNIGIVLIVAAAILFPLGLISTMAGGEIDKKDREFGPFLRSLGAMAVSTGTTITEALTRLDLTSFPTLEPDLERLRSRLAASLEPELCWHKFAMETGSKLLGETVKIFNDAIKLGGDPDLVAFLAADFSSRTIQLRAKRKVTAATFMWLTVVMHMAVSFLMVMVLEVINQFVIILGTATEGLDSAALQQFAGSLAVFNTPQVGFFRWMTISMVFLLSLINAYAIGVTDGGHKLKMIHYLSLMFLVSGVCLVIAPPLVEGIM